MLLPDLSPFLSFSTVSVHSAQIGVNVRLGGLWLRLISVEMTTVSMCALISSSLIPEVNRCYKIPCAAFGGGRLPTMSECDLFLSHIDSSE